MSSRSSATRLPRTAVALVALATAVRLALAAIVPLFPDETYYWEWSRHLAGGYFDHPPAIAILIRAGTVVLGATRLGVRIGVIGAGVLASVALVVLTSLIARSPGGASARTRAEPTPEDPPALDRAMPLDDGPGVLDTPESRTALYLALIPASLVGFAIATPDAPLLATIAVALVALVRAIAAPTRSRASFGWWCAAGVALGLGFSSKYTAVLLPLSVLVTLVTRRSLRPRLADPGPYVATLLALLVFAPTLLWNAHHGWISFAFQVHHGLGTPRGSALGRELGLVGGQLGLVTPILAVLAAIAVGRALRDEPDDRRYLLAVVATTVIAFFAISALRKPVEANWPAPAFIAAVPLLALWTPRGRVRGWFVAGIGLAAAVSLVVALDSAAHVLPLPPRRDPIARAQGWQDLASAVVRASRASGCRSSWIAADRYQDASELAFHLPDQPRVFSLNVGSRPNEYDLWPSLSTVAAPEDCILYVTDDGERGVAVVRQLGAREARPLLTAAMRWGSAVVGRRTVWLVRGIPSAPRAALALTPATRAALDSMARGFPRVRPVLDSLARVYRHGPAPQLVSRGSSPQISNADRQAVIAQRLRIVDTLLARAGLAAIYRDARFRECTFLRGAVTADAELGYVYAPAGCAITQQAAGAKLYLQALATDSELVSSRPDHRPAPRATRAAWLTYAAPRQTP